MITGGYIQVRVSDRQSLRDFSMTNYGCTDGVFLLLQDNANRLTGLSDVPTPGMVLNVRYPVPKLTPTNQSVAAYYKANSIIVTSDAIDVATGTTVSPIVVPYVTPGYIIGTTTASPFGNLVPPHRTVVQIIAANLLTPQIAAISLHP